MPQVTKPTLSLLVGTAIVLALAACGGTDEKSASAPAAKAPPPKTTVLTVSETQPSKKRYALEGIKAIPAGPVRIDFTTQARGEHQIQLVRVDGDHSEAEVRKILLAEDAAVPDWLHAAGGVTGVRSAAGRSTTEILPPGRYYALDDDRQGEPVPSAAERGAFATFEVTGEAQSASLPKTTATVNATDTADHKHSYEVSGLKVGVNTVLFRNESKEELHHIVIFKLQPGRTAQDAKTFLMTQGKAPGPPPVDFENGDSTAILDQKTEMVTTLNLRKAGDYVMVCFVPDRDGKGKPHFLEGMIKQVSVQ
jgi:hypothetical protein